MKEAKTSISSTAPCNTKIKIGGRKIGAGEPVYVVAEIGINHNGDLQTALKLIDASIMAGCDAVKFQKRSPKNCVPVKQRDVIRDTPWGPMTYLEYRHRVEFGEEEYHKIDHYCREKGIAWFASCWDVPSLEFMSAYEIPCFKVASANLTDLELLHHVRKFEQPIILSTGMSTMEEIRTAVTILSCGQLLIAHSTSSYTCVPEELNLRMIPVLLDEFGCPVGYSGHEEGILPSFIAVALGACFVERHITLDQKMWGSDHAASLEPQEFKRMVEGIRQVEVALGDGIKKVYDTELSTMAKLRNDR